MVEAEEAFVGKKVLTEKLKVFVGEHWHGFRLVLESGKW